MMPGMTTLNEVSVTVESGIASSWDISEDGMTYTFHLIPDISWVRYDPESARWSR